MGTFAIDPDRLRAGDRRALARSITLVESELPSHQLEAEALLEALMPSTGGSLRIGITGTPGVGKSTFIEAFGSLLVDSGLRIAVLAVDPSSPRGGGSILGDKTRMTRLARDERAFIRPSPSAGTLGGVASRTRETMLLCEAAGFDVVLVETVGVGQSELAVARMTDFFLVLMLAGAGDELQGIKRGVMELADALAINKADGDNLAAARRAASTYRAALALMHGTSEVVSWHPRVLTCSALEGTGVAEVWATIEAHRSQLTASGELQARRRAQQLEWLWAMVDERLRGAVRAHPQVAQALPGLERDVVDGRLASTTAARRILELFLGEVLPG